MTQTKKPKRWLQEVTGHCDALDLEDGVTRKDPNVIARSLVCYAEASERGRRTVTGLPC